MPAAIVEFAKKETPDQRHGFRPICGELTIDIDIAGLPGHQLEFAEANGVLPQEGAKLRAIVTVSHWNHPATLSMHSGPQISSATVRNSRSGFTFAGTSSKTEKSRGSSNRRRTCVSPGLRRNRSSNAWALSPFPFRPSHTRMA